MADGDEVQFSLLWKNYNINLCTGLYESLQRDDLVDVTLAAEGQLFKAHRLVLSLCSPYFQQMFTQMPQNQHAFVFLKDVPHVVLKDLIQFMYCGEVNVNQAVLSTFISTAEALQIKGLAENSGPSSTTKQTSSTPTYEPNEGPPNPFTIVHSQSLTTDHEPNAHQTTSNNSVADATVVGQQRQNQKQKRVVSRSNTLQSVSKRQKIDSSQSGHAIGTEPGSSTSFVQAKLKAKLTAKLAAKVPSNDQMVSHSDAMLAIKSEPNYENNDEVAETSDMELIKVEDGSYDEMKYGENHSVEDVEVAQDAKDVTMTDETQAICLENTQHKVKFIAGKTNKILVVDGHKFYKTKVTSVCTLWVCRCKKILGCTAKCRTSPDDRNIRFLDVNHNHGPASCSKESTSAKPKKVSRARNSI